MDIKKTLRLLAVASSLTACALLVSGCQTYSDTPSRVIVVDAETVAVADCSYLEFEKQGAWRREELPSMGRVRLLRGDDKYSISKVDFIKQDEKTRIEMRFMTPIQGKDYYPNQAEQIIRECMKTIEQTTKNGLSAL